MRALSKIAPYGPARLGPVAPAAIFMAFGEPNAIITTGYETPKYSAGGDAKSSFEVT